MVRDAIGLAGITMQDDGDVVPEPGTIKREASEGEIETYVDVDFMEYKKTLSIPAWLNAERENINFSRTLEEALMSKLETESK